MAKYLDQDGLVNVITQLKTYTDNSIPTIATSQTPGLVKGGSWGFNVSSSNGVPYASSVSAENYQSLGEYSFISKGTLDKLLESKQYATLNDIPQNLPTDDHINDLIDAKLEVIENGSY